MPRQVKGPDGVLHTFPDDATDLEISQALEAHPAKPARTWTDTAVDALPAVGGTVGGIVGGIGGTVAGFGVGGVPGAIGGAALGGGAGEAARQLVNRARGAGAPATMTEAAKDIGIQGGIQGATEAVGGAVASGLKAGGTAVYRGYIKPSLASSEIAKAREIVQTGIREWLPVTEFGHSRAARLISQINGQVDTALKASKEVVDLHQVADRVRGFAKRVYNRPGAPAGDFEAVMKVADEIDRHPSLGIPEHVRPTRVDVPAAQANETKQALDKAIGDTGFGVERNAGTEARKVGRYEARKAIEAKVPGVSKLNERESKLIDAMEGLQRAVGREENKNPLTGWGTTVVAGGVGGATYGASGDPWKALFSAMAIKGLIAPGIATRAAILSARFGESSMGRTTPAAAARLGLVMALRESNGSEQ